MTLLSARTDVAANEWPPLVPLSAPPPAKLPVDSFPPAVRDFSKAVAAATETPVELAAMSCLAVVAASIHGRYRVQVKPGYEEPAQLMVACVSPPATRKTPVWDRCTAPLRHYEQELIDRTEPERMRQASRRKTLESVISEKRKAAAKARARDERERLTADIEELELDLEADTPPPKLWTDDCTPERLASLMAANEGRIAVLSDEAGIFETLAGRYQQGVANLDCFLKGHAGSPVRVDRTNRPAIDITTAHLSCLLMVQPDILQSFSTKPSFRGRGLLGRFLYVYPPSLVGHRTGEAPPIPEDIEAVYMAAIHCLLDAKMEDTVALTLTPEAFQAWHGYAQLVEERLRDDGLYGHIPDWAGKLPGAVARIAAAFHCAANAPRMGGAYAPLDIGLDHVIAATGVGEALGEHALLAFDAMDADTAMDDARHLAKWIRRHGLRTFTRRDCYQANKSKSRFRTVADVDTALQVLVEHGHIGELYSEQGDSGRPRSPEYETNPEVLGDLGDSWEKVQRSNEV